jgi:hypothetical protein
MTASKTKKRLRMLISPAFDKWLKQASPEDLDELVRVGNALAATLKIKAANCSDDSNPFGNGILCDPRDRT